MASNRETVKVALREPVAQPWTDDDGEHMKWNVTTVDGTGRFTIFDTKIHAAILERKLVGVEREYIAQPARDPKKFPPTIIGIPGIVEVTKGRGGGGGGGRPMFTDQQVALLGAVLARAEGGTLADRHAECLRLLGATTPAPKPAQAASAAPAAPAAPASNGKSPREELLSEVVDWLNELYPDHDAARAFLQGRYGPGYKALGSLNEGQLTNLRDDLKERGTTRH